MNYNYDFLFCITPHYDIAIPVISPFLLKSEIKQNNFKSKVIDFNLDLSKKFTNIFEETVEGWTNVDILFNNATKKALTFPKFNDLIDQWKNIIVDHKPKYVGFSILTSLNYLCVIELAKRLKGSNIKVVVGGVSAKWFKEYLEKNDMLELIDHLVIGYGEGAIVKILNQEIKDKIILKPTIDFSNNIIPDYSDIDLSNYSYNRLYLSTSRGCIYHCSFCQVKHIWDKFVQRPIEYVLEEMIYMKEHHNINKFILTDSIINAVLPHFRKICTTLRDYDFEWHGMFSIRNQVMKENDYKLLSEAGCTLIHVGIESGS